MYGVAEPVLRIGEVPSCAFDARSDRFAAPLQILDLDRADLVGVHESFQAALLTYCAQGQRCAISIDPAACLTDAITHCPCAVEACDAGSCATAGMVSTCQQALQSEDCNAITNFPSASYWPTDCTPFMGSM